MTKFASTEEEGYKDFLGELHRWLEERHLHTTTPDNHPEHFPSARLNTRTQKETSRSIAASAYQDYRQVYGTSSDPPISQDNYSHNSQYVELGFPSSSIYKTSVYKTIQDSSKDLDRMVIYTARRTPPKTDDH